MKDTRKKLIDMIKKDEELEMYEEAFKHKVKAIPKEEILNKRCSKYEFINFDKQEISYNIMQEYANFCLECNRLGLPLIIAKDWYEINIKNK